jgi:hypothetical protein
MGKSADKKMSGIMLAKMRYCLSILGLVILANGCAFEAPRTRLGSLPTPPPGPRFYGPDGLGEHSYQYSPFENNGIVYTCKAGHIDITHVRCGADLTKYLTDKTFKALMKKDEGFTFRVSLESSRHKVRFGYPAYWDSLPLKKKEKIAEEISFDVGSYLSFNATLWHEILTWFGVHFVGFEQEFNSAFSWEDIYSNLLGAKLGVEALKDTKHTYDRAMTLAINRKLKELGAQPRSTAIDASEKMRGKWYTGFLNVDMIRRNMDVGLDDGFVTPVIVPGVCYGAVPEPLAVPTIAILSKYGFSMKYEIYPHEWEKDKILRVIYPDGHGDVIEPEKHFAELMHYIKKQAVEKYNYIIE